MTQQKKLRDVRLIIDGEEVDLSNKSLILAVANSQAVGDVIVRQANDQMNEALLLAIGVMPETHQISTFDLQGIDMAKVFASGRLMRVGDPMMMQLGVEQLSALVKATIAGPPAPQQGDEGEEE